MTFIFLILWGKTCFLFFYERSMILMCSCLGDTLPYTCLWLDPSFLLTFCIKASVSYLFVSLSRPVFLAFVFLCLSLNLTWILTPVYYIPLSGSSFSVLKNWQFPTSFLAYWKILTSPQNLMSSLPIQWLSEWSEIK